MCDIRRGGIEIPDDRILQYTTYSSAPPEFNSRKLGQLSRHLMDAQKRAMTEARRGVAILKKTLRDLPEHVRKELLNELMASML